MTQILRSDQVRDEFDRPVPGAKIYVYNIDGSDAALTGDGISSISQPLSTDEFGNYSYYADTNYYREDTWYGGKLRYRENNIALGNPGADLNLRSDLSASTGSSLINWIWTAAGSVLRSLRDVLRDQPIHINNFSVVGNGTTDDSVGLNAFIASINANPGKRHVIDARTFATTTALTPITVSNAWLEGPGAHIHDVGTLVTGAVIKYIGTSAPTGKLLQLSAVSGASNQRLANARIKGIGLNCNGLIGTGLSLLSVRDSEIDVAIVNPTDRCVDGNVVASLGEARDTQYNKITLRLRCIETPGGVGIVGGGDATANFSMNDLWVDAQYMNAAVYRGVNVDNNIWRRLRAVKGGGGTATEAVSLLGGATSAQSARDEKFPFYSSDTPIHVYGTGSYTAASLNHRITLDSGNGTPAPVIDAGASAVFEYGYTPTPEQPWATYTPTAVSTSGTITTLGTKLGEYRTMGRIVFYKAQIPITTNGTGALAVNVGLPAASAGTVGQTNAGIETALTSKGLTGYIAPGASVVTVRFSDGTYPGANGASLNISGWYET